MVHTNTLIGIVMIVAFISALMGYWGGITKQPEKIVRVEVPVDPESKQVSWLVLPSKKIDESELLSLEVDGVVYKMWPYNYTKHLSQKNKVAIHSWAVGTNAPIKYAEQVAEFFRNYVGGDLSLSYRIDCYSFHGLPGIPSKTLYRITRELNSEKWEVQEVKDGMWLDEKGFTHHDGVGKDDGWID